MFSNFEKFVMIRTLVSNLFSIVKLFLARKLIGDPEPELLHHQLQVYIVNLLFCF